MISFPTGIYFTKYVKYIKIVIKNLYRVVNGPPAFKTDETSDYLAPRANLLLSTDSLDSFSYVYENVEFEVVKKNARLLNFDSIRDTVASVQFDQPGSFNIRERKDGEEPSS